MTVLTVLAARRPPVIRDLDPERAAPGTAITVVGRHFTDSGRLEIDEVLVPPESIHRWSDSLIVFSLRENTRSGFLQVQTDDGRSNPVFITNEADLPLRGDDEGPRLDDIQPRTVQTGTVVRFVGADFGPPTARSRIILRGDDGPIELRRERPWLVRWSDQVVEYVIPPDIPAGEYDVEILGTPTGRTIEIAVPAGRPRPDASRRYTLRQELFAEGVTDQARAVFPIPRTLPIQDPPQLLRETAQSSPGPAPDTVIYRFFPVPDSAEREDDESEPVLLDRITRVDLVTRRSVRWEFTEAIDSRLYLDPVFRAGFAGFLRPLYPDGETDDLIDQIRRSDIDLDEDAVEILEQIADSVVTRLEVVADGPRSLPEALEEGGGAPGVYADLTVALARRSGVPARRHYGILLDDTGESRIHRWAELFVPAAGWVPLDTALADGAYGESVSSLREFYSADDATLPGTLDARRITLAVEGDSPARVFPGTVPVQSDLEYAPTRQHIEFPSYAPPDGVTARWEAPRLSPQFN
ncbi:MAG: transglutaminase-like domain-containing protein [Alkalispirochaeta sp.]